MVGNTSKKLEQLNREVSDLQDKTNKLEKECLRSEQEMRNTGEQLDAAVTKNKEQSKLLKQMENQLRGVENEVDQAVLERDSLENEHMSLSAENKSLDTELDSVLRQILEYERVNQ